MDSHAETEHIAAILGECYEHRVRPMIDLIDSLRREGLDKDVGLPTIVVVGDQSAGKSSVLEAISGVQLPRGTGIVTRCPLELILKNSASPWNGKIRYRGDGTAQEIPIRSSDDVEQLVRKAQDALTGNDKDLSPHLITVEIAGPYLPDLTLVDLPGIVRVVMEDQPKDIAEKIKQLINSYIEKPETIILAVIPASVDLETSEALAMARLVDPYNIRTIGVITKTDMVDKGAEDILLSVIQNKRYPLKKGYIAVKCRGQQAIDNNMTLEEALDEEKQFFEQARHFRSIKPELYGTPSLSSKLTDELVKQVKAVLPELKNQIFGQRNDTKQSLTAMGKGIPSGDMEKNRLLVEILSRYMGDLNTIAEGEEIDLYCGEELLIHKTCRKYFGDFTKQINSLIENEANCPNLDKVETIMADYRGRDLPAFIKFRTFKMMVKHMIALFDAPAKDCLEKVTNIINRKLRQVVETRFNRFPPLQSEVEHITTAAVSDTTHKANEALTELFQMEKMVFARDEIYEEHLEGKLSGVTDTERVFQAIQAYMQIAVTRISDTVPMVITRHMTSKVVEELKKKIFDIMGSGTEGLEVLREEESIQSKRDKLEEKLARLDRAAEKLNRFTYVA